MQGESLTLANRLGINVDLKLTEYQFVKDQIQKLPYNFVEIKNVIPLAEKNDATLVAFCNLNDIELIEDLKYLLKTDVIPVLSSKEAIKIAIEKCYHQKASDTSEMIAALKVDEKVTEEDQECFDLSSQEIDSPLIRLLNMILIEAIQCGASDIHLEPLENSMRIRYRIDGVLQSKHTPPREYQAQLIARIKVMAKLDIAEQRLPQDGRIKIKLFGRNIDLRVSTVPVVYGERINLRILDNSNILLGLDKLGLKGSLLEDFKKLIRVSEGIILVTGPTGSGKTTTLYSAISDINSDDVNIMTIEDPVEYKLAKVAQIGVKAKIGLTFSRGLRHILRQDPDIILVGEIRDKETAEIAVQAALTGHLVFSTLHTNDAPSAITRLVDMGIEPYLISSSIVGVLAQRLVRVICPNCKYSYKPSLEEVKELGLEFKEGITFCKGSGCPDCFGSGYKGRHGIFELMILNHQIKRQISESLDSSILKKLAKQLGMSDLHQEGAKLVLNGISTSEEILRVSRGFAD